MTMDTPLLVSRIHLAEMDETQDISGRRDIAGAICTAVFRGKLILHSETEIIADLIPKSSLIILEGEDYGS